MPRFPSRGWAEAYCEELNRNEGYARSGRGWVWPVLFRVTGLPKELSERFGGKEPGFVLMLNNGRCEGVAWYDDSSKADAPFVLSASFDDWLEVISGRLDPLVAIMRRKLVIEKGSFATIMRYSVAALEMVKSAQRVGLE